MARDFAQRFYHSKDWKTVRDLKISMVHGLCERCLKQGEIRAGDIVHHTVELNAGNIGDPGVALNVALLEYVCIDCHNLEHKGGNGNPLPDGLMFDARGQVVRRMVSVATKDE